MVEQKILEEFVSELKPEAKENNKTYSAIVSKIDKEGTVWVRVAGSDKDTPTALVGAEVKKGDAVNVEWRNNKLYIASNYSNPAAGVVRVGAVEQAAQLAHEAANNAVLDAGRAKEAADSASASAQVAQDSIKSVVQGATTVEKAVSVMQTALEAVVDYDPVMDTTKEYFWHDANGAHVLGTSGDYRADIKSTGMNIVDTSTENAVATFGTETSIKTSDGTELAHFGYDLGTSQSGTAVAPYYTFGIRESGSVVGNYSVAEGSETTASGNVSHAEGYITTANGMYSHAEGWSTIANGTNSHAEGGETTASGDSSHAEGYETIASGNFSHTQNRGTVATEASQTVIGKYNKATRSGSGTESDPYIYTDVGNYAFIIGNGTADNARSNALTVTWDGNVELALDTTAVSGTTDGDLYAAIVALGWQNDVIV